MSPRRRRLKRARRQCAKRGHIAPSWTPSVLRTMTELDGTVRCARCQALCIVHSVRSHYRKDVGTMVSRQLTAIGDIVPDFKRDMRHALKASIAAEKRTFVADMKRALDAMIDVYETRGLITNAREA